MNAKRFIHDPCSAAFLRLRTITTSTTITNNDNNNNKICLRARPSRTNSSSSSGGNNHDMSITCSLWGGDAPSSLSSRRISSVAEGGRLSSSCSNYNNSSNIPSLHGPAGGTPSFLQGLDVHTVPAQDDGHPLAVYTIQDNNKDDDDGKITAGRIPVLLLHGRTWSSPPVYHLIGDAGDDNDEAHRENRSLLQALYDARHNNNNNNIQPYAMDFRGFGGTPRLSSSTETAKGNERGGGGFVEPLQCVSDAVSVLKWIGRRHHNRGRDEGTNREKDMLSSRPALLGWSHGALIAQITAQRHPELVSKLILYGSIYNPHATNIISPRGADDATPHAPTGRTDHDDFPLHEMAARNEYDGAMEDFTSVDCTTTRSARLFAKAALACDPIKVQWKGLHQLNECEPSLVKVPTLVISGDSDPYAPVSTQADLFTNLGRGADKMWTIIANADHAVHLSDERHRFVENVSNFLRATIA